MAKKPIVTTLSISGEEQVDMTLISQAIKQIYPSVDIKRWAKKGTKKMLEVSVA